MHSHFRTSAFFLSLILILLGLPATLPCVSAPPQQSAVAAPSFAALESRAQAGDAVAEYDLAVAYLRSNPAAPDYNSAIKWLNASSVQGNVDAQFLLGYLYEHGEGSERDYAKAAANYQAAAVKGHAAAANNLASLYQHGMGVPKDLRKALEWYLAAAQAGESVGQCNLALMYYRGEGVARDYVVATRPCRNGVPHPSRPPARCSEAIELLAYSGKITGFARGRASSVVLSKFRCAATRSGGVCESHSERARSW